MWGHQHSPVQAETPQYPLEMLGVSVCVFVGSLAGSQLEVRPAGSFKFHLSVLVQQGLRETQHHSSSSEVLEPHTCHESADDSGCQGNSATATAPWFTGFGQGRISPSRAVVHAATGQLGFLLIQLIVGSRMAARGLSHENLPGRCPMKPNPLKQHVQACG